MSARPDPHGSPALPRGFLRASDAIEGRLYLRPLERRVSEGSRLEILIRGDDGIQSTVATVADVRAWARQEGATVEDHVAGLLKHLGAPPSTFAGLALARPLIMGIINVTPDSFSDGGETFDTAAALARGRTMVDAGADILDVGGESTRPGAAPISIEEERARVLPVVRGLSEAGFTVSIDTRHAAVMEAALKAGAAMVNDITALTADAGSADVVAAQGAAAILMHMQGDPTTMQIAPRYQDAALDIHDYLAARVVAAEAAGIRRADIAVDPGIGFGKTRQHNVEILGRLSLLHGLGCAVVVGVSRKSLIAALDRDLPPKERVAGSLALALAAADHGVHILRVHDVAETRQALAVWQAIRGAGGEPRP